MPSTAAVELSPGMPDDMSDLAAASAIHKAQSDVHAYQQRPAPRNQSGNGTLLAAAAITGLVGLILGVPIGYIMGQGAADPSQTPTPTKNTQTAPKPNTQTDLLARIKLLPVRFVSSEHDAEGTRLAFEISNNTGRAIDSFKGAVRIFDQFGDHLDGLVITRDDPLDVGARFSVTDKWTVSPRTKELLDKNAQKLKIVYEADVIIYADGTRDEFKWPSTREYMGS